MSGAATPERTPRLRVAERFLEQADSLDPQTLRDVLAAARLLAAGRLSPTPARRRSPMGLVPLDHGGRLVCRLEDAALTVLALDEGAETAARVAQRHESLDDGGRSYAVDAGQLARLVRSRRESSPWPQLRQALHLGAEQQRLVGLRARGPLLIQGGAGSGKTTVAIHRALSLARQGLLHGRPRVALFTARDELRPVLRRLLAELAPDLDGAVVVQSPRRWCRAWSERESSTPRPESDEEAMQRLGECIDDLRTTRTEPELALPVETFRSEIEDVLLANGLHRLEDYLRAPRAGRGRLGARARAVVWDVSLEYLRRCEEAGRTPWPILLRRATRAVQEGRAPGYDHVVVDGAHELRLPELRLLCALAGRGSLSLLAERETPLWRPGLRLSEAGLRFSGRSHRLRRNQHRRRPILEAARSVLPRARGARARRAAAEDPAPQLWDERLETQLPLPFPGVIGGRRPTLLRCAGWREELDAAADIMVRALEKGRRAEHLCYLARSRPLLESLSAVLDDRGLEHRLHRPDRADALDSVLSANAARLLTIEDAAGLEFPVVVVLGVDDRTFPRPTPPVERPGELRAARRLLYLGMTRAIEELWLTCRHDRPSPLLPDRELRMRVPDSMDLADGPSASSARPETAAENTGPRHDGGPRP